MQTKKKQLVHFAFILKNISFVQLRTYMAYRVFGKYCPMGTLGNFSGIKVLYKSAAIIRRKGWLSMYKFDLSYLIWVLSAGKGNFSNDSIG